MLKSESDPFEGKITFTEKIDGEDYIGCKETSVYKSADELTAALLKYRFSDEDSEYIFKTVDIRKEGTELIFAAEINTQEAEPDDDDDDSFSFGGTNPNDMFKLNITVTMPGEVKSHTAGTLEGKTVTWDIQDLTASNKIEVVSETGEKDNTSIVVIIIIVLIVVLVILLIVQKCRKQKA